MHPMPRPRRRALLFALALLVVGGGLASANWDRLERADFSFVDATEGRPLVEGADVALQARDSLPLRTEDGWRIRRVRVRVDRAVLVPGHFTQVVQVASDTEITFRVPLNFRADVGST